MVLSDGDNVVLLTPVVVPFDWGDGTQQCDPFEPLGRALSGYRSLRLRVHHIPYTARYGIGQTHIDIIERQHAKLVIFVISGPPANGQTSQVDMAERLRVAAGDRHPQVILACCDIRELGERLETGFSAIVQVSGYSRAALEAAAIMLFRGDGQKQHHQEPKQQQPERQQQQQQQYRTPANMQNLVLAPRKWTVEDLDERRDVPGVHKLWSQAFGQEYGLNLFELQSLLSRDGYAMHYVVREPPRTGEIVGFCATYTTYMNSGVERLVGSLAVLVVRPEYRRRGVGLSLHEHALAKLKKTRGVCRLNLGSTFPRIFFGLPVGIPSEDWFRRRGWQLDDPHGVAAPGKGQEACDWVLRFNEYPERDLGASSSSGSSAEADLRFRPCEPRDYPTVLELVADESLRGDNMGWYDQYALAQTANVGDIVVGVIEESTVVAAALTYVPGSESPVARDLPWAGKISPDTGGVTCICIADNRVAAMNVSRDVVMIRLLDACVNSLREQNMSGMFIDAVKGGHEGFQVMGFQKWAKYREVWRPAGSGT